MRHASRFHDPARGRWWSPVLVGAATGLIAGWLVRTRSTAAADRARGGPGTLEERDARWERWRDTWDDVVEGATEGLASARELVSRRQPLDVEALQDRLTGMACSTECRVRVLGEGIVEVVGACPSEEDARALLDELVGQPGVEVVVNRVWTPASSDPGPTDG